MASVSENSIASVPLSEMARIREMLLQEPEAGSVARTQLSGTATSTSNTRYVSAEVAVSIVESANAYHTPNSSPKAPPRISTSKSASAVEMEAMVHASPSQEAFRTLTRASSFHGYPGGDTQLMESQVYRDFKETNAKFSTTTPAKAAEETFLEGNSNTYDTLATDKTTHTCVEGDTGYIDLENALQSPGAVSVSSDLSVLPTSPQAQQQIGDCAAAVFALPKTPAVAGRKRSRSGELLTSEVTSRKQPGFSQFGGQNGPMLSTTQLFNQTQAPSSPLPDGPRSDPVITRPSPNLHLQFSTSSPTRPMSSPVASMRPSTALEPRDYYTSLRESQERRRSRPKSEQKHEPDFDDTLLEDENEEPDTQRQLFENRRIHRAKSEQALKEFGKFRAPSRTTSRPTSSGKPGATIDLTTPAATKKADTFDFEVSDDDHDEIVDQEPDQSDDEYYELGQTVLRSQGYDQEAEEEEENVPVVAADVQMEDVNVETKNAPRDDFLQQVGNDDREGAQPITQRSAIADSQPMRLEQSRSLPQPRANDPSSISYVPGSQYASKDGEDQALLSSRISSKPHQSTPLTHQAGDSILSSPPLPVASSDPPTNFTEPFRANHYEETNLAEHPSVPESDLPEIYADGKGSSRPVTANSRNEAESNNLPVFSTAETHLLATRALRKDSPVKGSPGKLIASQRSNAASQSPLKAAGVRHFADITAAKSLSRGESRETDVDVDAFMRDVITADDEQYIEAMSSPPLDRPQKRRKISRMRSKDSTPLANNDQSSIVEEQPFLSEVEEVAIDTAISNTDNNNSTEPRGLRSTNALQESPSKANEMRATTPESVQERERAGAKAVSQLLSTRFSKPQRSKSRNRKAAEPKASTIKKAETENIPKRRISAKSKKEEAEQAQDVPENATTEYQGSADVGSVAVKPVISDVVETSEPERISILAPNRIFALFKGSFNNFYPATWLSSSADGSSQRVKFDDGTVTSIDNQHVRKLELLVGDQVKVDLPNMRKGTWFVRSFAEALAVGEAQISGTDIFGHDNLQVEAKSSRNSSRTSETVADEEAQLVNVAVSAIYLTHTMWPHFNNRTFTPPATSSSTFHRMVTPSSSAQTGDSETPTSKSRRTVMPTAKALNGRPSHLREGSVPAATSPTTAGLFSGMLFALSYGSNGDDKENVARLIRRNGGVIVENGFDELFDLPSLDPSAATSPLKKSPGKGNREPLQDAGLQLKSSYLPAGFVALIADTHSRRAKYVQALALGLPTLSGRWILDSLEASRNGTLSTTAAAPLPWSKYLLPAGESSYLGGAVRSRSMELYSAKDAKLCNIIDNRDLLLDGDGVLIVAPKKGKGNWEKRKAYAFLTLALGAGRVKRVSDLEDAKALVSDEPEIWKWVYVDGSVAEASYAMFDKGKGGGRKRKRGEDSGKTEVNEMSAGDGNVRIVNDEFVVQSLILGALVE